MGVLVGLLVRLEWGLWAGLLALAAVLIVMGGILERRERRTRLTTVPEHPIGVYEADGERVEMPLDSAHTASASVFGPLGTLIRIIKMDLVDRGGGSGVGTSVFANENYDDLSPHVDPADRERWQREQLEAQERALHPEEESDG